VSATLNADSGTTGVDPGLVHVTPFFESDGTVQYVYGGDELGNLWRFDLVNNTTLKIGTLLDASNNPQPVTAPVALVYAYGKRIVYVGTGRVLGLSDLTPNNRTQSVYAIADGGTTYATVRSGMVAQTYTAATDAMTSNPVNWASDRGWYVDLPSNEQAHTGVSVAFGAAVFTTNKSQISDCSASSKLYVVDALDGSMVDGLTSVATVLSSTYMTSGATLLRGKVEGSPAPGSNCASTNTCPCTKGVIASVMLGNGVTTQRCIAPNQAVTARRNSWRDVRR